MAKSSITNIVTTNTFQNWFDKTNELVNLIKTDVLTASLATANGDITIGNATLQGNFTANNVTVSSLLRVDSISPKVGSTAIAVSAPVNITTNQTVLNRLTSTSGPRISLFNSGDTDWQVGFENNTNKNFIITNGAGYLKLLPSGNLEITGLFTGTAQTANTVTLVATNTTNATHYPTFVDTATGVRQVRTDTGFTYNPNSGVLTSTGFAGNLTGNVTGNVTGNLTGNVTGNAGTVTNGVYTTGNQIISGIKTFTAPITISTNTPYILLSDTISGGSDWRMVVGSSAFVLQTDANGYATNKLLIDTTGNLTVSGDVTAFSDERLKTNIKTITSPLDKVLALRGVSFEKDGKTSIGVIAQEIEKVIPEVVHDGDYKSVSYGNLVGLLIEAIKELKIELDELKGT